MRGWPARPEGSEQLGKWTAEGEVAEWAGCGEGERRLQKRLKACSCQT